MSFSGLLVDGLTKADSSDLIRVSECATQVLLKEYHVKQRFEFYNSGIFDDYLNLKVQCNIAINYDKL